MGHPLLSGLEKGRGDKVERKEARVDTQRTNGGFRVCMCGDAASSHWACGGDRCLLLLLSKAPSFVGKVLCQRTHCFSVVCTGLVCIQRSHDCHMM